MQQQPSVRMFSLGAVIGTILLVGTCLPAPVHAGASKPKGPDRNCYKVAQDSSLACQNSAQEEYWLAIAHCDNAPGKDAKGLCPKAAQSEQRTERKECGEKLAGRKDICDQLGGGKYNPAISPSNFTTQVTNPLFPLQPGTTFNYEGDTADGHESEVFQVTHETREFLGVSCVAVRDTSTLDGELSEDTIDWFAQDTAGNVWYFGEDSRAYEDGILVSIDGSWLTGVDGAQPGIVMKASPKAGDVYRQEYAIDEAEDMADIVGLGRSVTVPYGSWGNALETHEFSGLEPSASERKFYIPSIGFVLAVDDETGKRLELVSITHD